MTYWTDPARPKTNVNIGFNIDPEHRLVHKVYAEDLKKYLDGDVETISSECGKVWSPHVPLHLDKPRCPQCFPPRAPFSIAA